MKKEDFKKGQKVWLYLVGDAARRCNTPEDRVQEYEVVSVGRKYITVNKTGLSTSLEIKFDIENNFRQVYTCGSTEYILFPTRDEIINYVTSITRKNVISHFFARYNWGRLLTDEDVKTIYNIIKQHEDRI